MNIITIGTDLAKNIFAVHGVDENGKAGLVKPKVPRDRLRKHHRQPAAVPDRLARLS